MIDKKTVLKLAEDAGFTVLGDEILYGAGGMVRNAYPWFHELIELAKAQGAAEERTLSYEREKEIVRLACKAAADQAREHQKEIESIRARNQNDQ